MTDYERDRDPVVHNEPGNEETDGSPTPPPGTPAPGTQSLAPDAQSPALETQSPAPQLRLPWLPTQTPWPPPQTPTPPPQSPAPRPLSTWPPIWPVMTGLLVIVAIAAAMTLGLTRSGALTIVAGRHGDTESSLNWAGYVTSHDRFRSVTATWKVPAVRTVSDPQATASFWVGLDGRDSHSLQQIGTTSGTVDGTPHYGAWWEMLPGPAVDVPMTISPGDTITASVAADGHGTFTLSLHDATNGQRFVTRQVDAAARLSSAEVVTEAPSTANGQLPLADFGTVRFIDARANGRPLNAFHWSKVDMTGSTGKLATASDLSHGGSSFTVVRNRP